MHVPIETDLPNWVRSRVGASLLSLRPCGPWSVCDDGPVAPESAAVQLAFRVPPAALEACHAELVARGVPILRAPTDLPSWRHRTLFFRDPEDNVLEIYAEYRGAWRCGAGVGGNGSSVRGSPGGDRPPVRRDPAGGGEPDGAVVGGLPKPGEHPAEVAEAEGPTDEEGVEREIEDEGRAGGEVQRLL